MNKAVTALQYYPVIVLKEIINRKSKAETGDL
jgi:hypothetical protein